MTIRFLRENELTKTKPLAAECFGSGEETDEYYENDVQDNRIAVLEEQGAILSMVQLRRFLAVYEDTAVPAWYILYVGTAPEERHKGYMSKVMRFVLSSLKEEGAAFAFLVPVEAAIYAHLGFTHAWKFNESERALLYADDGLTECFACLLNAESFAPPVKLQKADTLRSLYFQRFDAEAAAEYFDYFALRPNKSYGSIPLDSLLWSDTLRTEYCVSDGRCLMLRYGSDGGFSGCIPFCREEELPYYFALQERYFHEVLHLPFRAFLQDSEGVEALRSAGLLTFYEASEETETFDYIYSGDDLRTLAGRKFAKKRNHIHQFENEYGGRWEYRRLDYEDRDAVLAFLRDWEKSKTAEGGYVNLGKSFDAADTLAVELQGVEKILSSPALLKKLRFGGIFLDGKLCAFSVGGYNPREKTAVIEIEKADPEITGLYQVINREFLCHEFPEAEFVNREDDVALPGLRQAKNSYHPILLEKRYTILPKDSADI